MGNHKAKLIVVVLLVGGLIEWLRPSPHVTETRQKPIDWRVQQQNMTPRERCEQKRAFYDVDCSGS